jgi:hypothetical protein
MRTVSDSAILRLKAGPGADAGAELNGPRVRPRYARRGSRFEAPDVAVQSSSERAMTSFCISEVPS